MRARRPLTVDPRSDLVAFAQRRRARRGDSRATVDGKVYATPYRRLLERVEAGEPVEVPAFYLTRRTRSALALHPSGRVRVEPDGSVVELS